MKKNNETVTEIIETINNVKKRSLDLEEFKTIINAAKGFDETEELKKIKKLNKLQIFWNNIKEYGRLIKFWFIAEYNIWERLVSAIRFKNNELKVRKNFTGTKYMLVSSLGYEKGMKKYYNLCYNINGASKLNKKMLKVKG